MLNPLKMAIFRQKNGLKTNEKKHPLALCVKEKLTGGAHRRYRGRFFPQDFKRVQPMLPSMIPSSPRLAWEPKNTLGGGSWGVPPPVPPPPPPSPPIFCRDRKKENSSLPSAPGCLYDWKTSIKCIFGQFWMKTCV